MIKFEQNLLDFNCTNSQPQSHITDKQVSSTLWITY
jgi:hypothetical protein